MKTCQLIGKALAYAMLSSGHCWKFRQEWRNVESLYHFLMDELHTVTEEFENPSHAAHEVCVLLCVDGQQVPEIFYRLYSANLKVDEMVLINAVSYFAGAGLLTIDCECSDDSKPLCDIHNIKNTDFYHAGFKDGVEHPERIQLILEHIEQLRGYLLNVN